LSDEDKEPEKRKPKDERSNGDLASNVIGAIFPGLGKVIDELKKSSDFKEKLAEANDEIERRVQGKVPQGAAKPHIDFHVSVRTLVDGKEIYRYSRTKGSARGIGRKAPVEVLDMIDEPDHLIVIVELHGIEEKDVEARIEGKNKMILQVNGGYLDETELPTQVGRIVGRKYSNGVLEIRLEKEKKNAD
jgi:HSP20 family molecular chaperone IbpA